MPITARSLFDYINDTLIVDVFVLSFLHRPREPQLVVVAPVLDDGESFADRKRRIAEAAGLGYSICGAGSLYLLAPWMIPDLLRSHGAFSAFSFEDMAHTRMIVLSEVELRYLTEVFDLHGVRIDNGGEDYADSPRYIV